MLAPHEDRDAGGTRMPRDSAEELKFMFTSAAMDYAAAVSIIMDDVMAIGSEGPNADAVKTAHRNMRLAQSRMMRWYGKIQEQAK
jgi:hypothetical protein